MNRTSVITVIAALVATSCGGGTEDAAPTTGAVPPETTTSTSAAPTTTQPIVTTTESDLLIEARALETAQAYAGAESVDEAMGLVADDAVFNIGSLTYTGKDEIRAWLEANEGNLEVEASGFSATGNTVSWVVVIELLENTTTRRVVAVIEDGKIQSLRAP